MFSEALAAEGAVVFAKTCELGLEGIVSKRVGGFYKSGKSRNWLKTTTRISLGLELPRDAITLADLRSTGARGLRCPCCLQQLTTHNSGLRLRAFNRAWSEQLLAVGRAANLEASRTTPASLTAPSDEQK